jgi:hypothetical protein
VVVVYARTPGTEIQRLETADRADPHVRSVVEGWEVPFGGAEGLEQVALMPVGSAGGSVTAQNSDAAGSSRRGSEAR